LTKEQLSTFISLANYASAVYGGDVEKCTRYIKMRMDYLFGMPSYFFMVLIQTQPTVGNRYIWVNHDSVFAALAGINKLYPQWSYFFSRNYGSDDPARNVYFTPGQRGKGITDELYSLIVKSINETPEDKQCLCPRESMASVSQALKEVDYGGWSLICAADAVTYGIILNYQDLWVSAKFRGCHYTVYNN
jgi:hypothetical protein